MDVYILENYNKIKGLYGSTGFGGEAGHLEEGKLSGLDYNGAPILMDEKATSGMFAMVNEEFMDFYALPYKLAKPVSYKSQIEGNDYEAPIGLGFSWSDWIIPANSASVVGHVYFGGQFITTNPKRHGKLTGVTGI